VAHGAPHSTPDSALGGRFSAFRSSDFRSFWIATLISQCGGWMAQVATSWLLLEMTNSALFLGLQGIFLSVPFIASSMVAGAVADRIERKRLLVITQWASALVFLVQTALVYLGLIQVWHIYLFSALSWTAAGFETAARQSLMPHMVARSQLPSAVTLFSTLHRATSLLGPALGGLTIASFGVAGAMLGHSAGFALIAIVTMLMRSSSRGTGASGPLYRAVADGMRYARTHRKIAALIVLQASASVLVNAGALLPIYARDILMIGPEGFGFLHSAIGAGSITGTALVMWLGHTASRGRWILIGSFVYPLFLAGFAYSTYLPLSMLMLFGSGVVDMLASTLRQTVMQLTVDDAFRGRVMSLNSIAARGVSPLGNFQNGAVASVIGAPPALVLSSALALLVVIWVAIRAPEIAERESHPDAQRQPSRASVA
jgi:MFS family permease